MFNLSNRPAARRLSETAILGMMLGASACNFDVKSNCATEANDVAADPANDLSVEHNLPKSCPVTAQQGGTMTDYGAVVHVVRGRAQGRLDLIFTDWDQYVITQADYPVVNDPNDAGYARVTTTGAYRAGRVQPEFGSQPEDLANNELFVTNGLAEGIVHLTYRYPALAAMYPNTATVDEWYTQELQVSPGYNPVAPVRYEWFQDGSSLGPAANGASSVSVVFHTIGAHSLEAVATDANGRVERFSQDVQVAYPGGCDREPCP
jgi:hypothetical protein